MTYLSVCSGIEAASVAWEPLGWTPALFSEIEAFPRAVLRERQRARDVRRGVRADRVPLWGDFTTIRPRHLRRLGINADIDVLVGGTPCQSFSVAGLRKGLDDERGNLALEFLRLARRLRPRWVVWENVPGVLSSNGGRDFGAFLGGLAELGYGFAYRVLDAQYVRVESHPRAVPQRRRRVFVVGHLGDWRRAAAVLFERESLSGHPAPRREAGKAAPTIPSRSSAGGGLGTDFDCDGGIVAGALCADSHPGAYSGQDAYTGRLVPTAFGGNRTSGPLDVATACQAHPGRSGRQDFGSETFLVQSPVAFTCKDHGADAGEIAPTLRSMGHDGSHANGGGQIAVAFSPLQNGRTFPVTEEAPTLEAGTGNKAPAIAQTVTADMYRSGGATAGNNPGVRNVLTESMAVRRLTPRECERLQGFPDDYTAITYRGKPAADGPRYKALGNSMATNCMRWLGERIALVESMPERTEVLWLNDRAASSLQPTLFAEGA